MESDSDSMRYCGSHGSRVPRPNERLHAHCCSQPAEGRGGGVTGGVWCGGEGECQGGAGVASGVAKRVLDHAHCGSQPKEAERGNGRAYQELTGVVRVWPATSSPPPTLPPTQNRPLHYSHHIHVRSTFTGRRGGVK